MTVETVAPNGNGFQSNRFRIPSATDLYDLYHRITVFVLSSEVIIQSTFRALSEHFQSSLRTVLVSSLRYGNFCLVSARLSLNRHYPFTYFFFRAVSEQFHSSFRAGSEHFKSSFRAVL